MHSTKTKAEMTTIRNGWHTYFIMMKNQSDMAKM
jgi:hypothetical protein